MTLTDFLEIRDSFLNVLCSASLNQSYMHNSTADDNRKNHITGKKDSITGKKDSMQHEEIYLNLNFDLSVHIVKK